MTQLRFDTFIKWVYRFICELVPKYCAAIFQTSFRNSLFGLGSVRSVALFTISICLVISLISIPSKKEFVRDGPLEKWWGVGGRGIFRLHEFFFFAHYLCTIFFKVKHSARIFFFKQIIIAFFFSAKSWFIIYFCALWIIIHSQQIKGFRPFFNHVWKIFSKMYWEEEVTLIGRLPCAFF